jgi:RNA-directed DNA polymerase
LVQLAGVLEDGKRIQVEAGTPQGGSASPLLANVFDLWVRAGRRRQACGDVIVVLFADDIALGFQHKSEAERFGAELVARSRKFGLELHPDKTRLAVVGHLAADDRQRRGQGKPETFAFLCLTHMCGKSRSGKFTVRRQTIRKRLQAKLAEVKIELRRGLHDLVPEVGKWLGAVVRGHLQYYGVPLNYSALFLFRSQVGWLWRRALARRSQKGQVLWDRMRRLIDRWLPPVRIYHPYPQRPHAVTT